MKVVVHVDGGARGNPGPARPPRPCSTPDGEVLDEAHELLGARDEQRRRVPRAAARAAPRAGAGRHEVEVVNDSELVAKQVTGTYRVKHPDMKPLHAAALAALRAFERWTVRSVPRAQNARADALVNAALDARPLIAPPLDQRRRAADTDPMTPADRRCRPSQLLRSMTLPA